MAQRIASIVLALALALVPSSVEAAEARQAPGYAEIASPEAGSAVQGIVTITGSANHPSFTAYDLAFAYADNPTDTWFPLGPTVRSAVVQGPLGLWDTSRISPGAYVLRLRVFLSTGAVLESQARGITIGLPTTTPAPGAASPTSTSVPPTPTLVAPFPTPPGAAARPDPVGSALAIGGATAVAGLVLLAVYLALQRSLSVWLGDLRMRRVLRGPRRSRPPR
jgi:hypothetical protein